MKKSRNRHAHPKKKYIVLHYIDEKSHSVFSYPIIKHPTKSSQINDFQAEKHDDNQISSPLNIDLNNENCSSNPTNDSKPSNEPSFSASINDLEFTNEFTYLNSADLDYFNDIFFQDQNFADFM